MSEQESESTGLSCSLPQCLRWCAEARWKRLSRWPEIRAVSRTNGLAKASELRLAASLAQASARWLQRHQNTEEQSPPLVLESDLDCGVALAFGALALAEQFLLLDQPVPARRQVRRFWAMIKLLALRAGAVVHPDEERDLDLSAERLCLRLAVQAQAHRILGQDHLPLVTFVLGMHRSGTSALAGLLCEAGMAVPGDLMPSNHVNPKGFFESQGLFKLNEDLFDALDRDWMALDPLPAGWIDSPCADRWRLSSLEHLTAVYPQRAHVVIKDPRYCLLLAGLEDWWEGGSIDARFLFIVRDPLEVAQSLCAAHPIGLEHALNLWLLHGFAAERVSRTQSRLIVVFQQLLEDPAAVLAKVLSFVNPTAAESIPAEQLAQIADFVDPSLHRQRLDANQALSAAASPSLRRVAAIASQVYAILREGSQREGGLATATAELARLEQLWILGRSTQLPQGCPGGSAEN